MTRQPAPFQALTRHAPASAVAGPAPHEPHHPPPSPQQLRAAEVAQAQTELKRELTRVYAEVCGACVRKD